MKKAVIIEDETIATENLIHLLHEIRPEIEIVSILQTVEESITYFKEPHHLDLVFMDIHLSDGLAFMIFDEVEVPYPIIFTTSFDQHALEAFKVNCIDYLMKPIRKTELERALTKIEHFTNSIHHEETHHKTIEGLLDIMKNMGSHYKANFLIPQGDKLLPLAVDKIACFYIETKITHAITFEGKTHAIDQSLDDIIKRLDPHNFYRANRQYIISIKSVQSITPWVGGKLNVTLSVKTPTTIIIPKAKTGSFKLWYTK